MVAAEEKATPGAQGLLEEAEAVRLQMQVGRAGGRVTAVGASGPGNGVPRPPALGLCARNSSPLRPHAAAPLPGPPQALKAMLREVAAGVFTGLKLAL